MWAANIVTGLLGLWMVRLAMADQGGWPISFSRLRGRSERAT
jgi:hypothetical protein